MDAETSGFLHLFFKTMVFSHLFHDQARFQWAKMLEISGNSE
jgi:hypothetical protein